MRREFIDALIILLNIKYNLQLKRHAGQRGK